ncbi:hypothetical protein PIB30_016346 [Stylosanthes scabra]|uniref:Uncharacterized protein n=1 Tax=Stylosanthes scabra TaxID=79078 RepID=A0ABU6S7I5_9FABA|nr:hypothetical protein [Stylosanthes scabra]
MTDSHSLTPQTSTSNPTYRDSLRRLHSPLSSTILFAGAATTRLCQPIAVSDCWPIIPWVRALLQTSRFDEIHTPLPRLVVFLESSPHHHAVADSSPYHHLAAALSSLLATSSSSLLDAV